MTKLSIKPPRVNINAKGASFWKQIGMIVIGTTISLVFTLMAAKLTENRQRTKDRRLSAMMVMSNIEKFARTLEDNDKVMATSDSIATWLLSKPVEELEQMPADQLDMLMSQATATFFLSYDKSAENIFSNNIETWKNMGNVQFIDQVGQCFSAMHSVEEYFNNRMTDAEAAQREVLDHPDQYEGSSSNIKLLRCDKIRQYLSSISSLRAWLRYTAAALRYHNRTNMAYIDISEQEVMEYTDSRDKEMADKEPVPNFNNFYSGPLNPDSLTSMRKYDALLNPQPAQ